jgi:hypothetical protein
MGGASHGGGNSRHVLLHAHMFKNAGSTLDSSLQRSFAAGFVDHRDDELMRRGAQYLGPYIQDHPELGALSSHWMTFPLPQLDGVTFHLAMLFRDPLQRIVSVYRFEGRQQQDSPGPRKARELDLPGYVRWRLQEGRGPVIRNFQTRYCSCSYMGQDLEKMYGQALALVGSTPLVGLVERYEESMTLFEYHLRSFFPDIDLSAKAINTSDTLALTAEQKRMRAMRELAPVMEEVTAANRYDLRLYSAIETQFERALRAVPDFNERLKDLRERGQRLQ